MIVIVPVVERFGDIYTIRILREDVVVVNSPELVREVLCQTGSTIAGRPPFFRIEYGFHGAKDIIFGTYRYSTACLG